MKKYIFIVLLFSYGFGQDKYPYFSDMAKQLEFEKKRIIIEEGERTQQIITGGGSEYNIWSLLAIRSEAAYLTGGSLPVFKNAPIETHYEYLSFFNI